MANTQNASLVAATKPMTATGAVLVAPIGTELPTSADAELDAAYDTLGYLSEDGITNSIETDSETITAYGGDTVLTIMSSRTETFTFRPIELNKVVLAAQWGKKNVDGDDASGLAVKHTADEAEECIYVFAMALTGGRKQLLVCPKAKMTELGENAYIHTDAQGHEMTVTAMPDASGVSVYQYISGSELVDQPRVKEAKASDKSEFDEFLSSLGKSDPNNVGEPVFYLVTDAPLNRDTDYLVTVEAKGKSYGLACPHDGRGEGATIIYFSLTDGYQVDFVDGKPKQGDAEAACDLSDYSGTVTLTLYKTDPQQPGAYPTGLVRMKAQAITLSNA